MLVQLSIISSTPKYYKCNLLSVLAGFENHDVEELVL